ncbi:MAG: type VI secretion system tube protein TssD [Bacteroidales bacterium]
MKKYISISLALMLYGCLSSISLIAQDDVVYPGEPPQALTYQAEVRDSKGNIIKNTSIVVTASIIQGPPTNITKWSRDYQVTSDKYGMFTIILADDPENPPSREEDKFSSIDWKADPHFLNVTFFDDEGNFHDMGATQFLSVPYAMHAQTAFESTYSTEALSAGEVKWANILYVPSGFADNTDNVDDEDADPTNELQSISLAGTTLSISDGNDINLPIESITEEPGLILDHVILRLPGMQDREVLKIDFSISRQVNELGQPTSSLNIDAIKIKMAALNDGKVELAEWMSDPFAYKDGDIDYIGINGQILRPLSFKRGYLISYKEIYEPKLGLIEEIVISPQEITTGNAMFQEIWN